MQRRLEHAFSAAPRELFLPLAQRINADHDGPLPIGFGVTNSQPSTVAKMLTLLDVPEGAKVLDVGSGSGWTSALLAELVGRDGSVLAVERIPELVSRACAALSEWPQVRIRKATFDVLGAPEEAPFDRILVSAMAETVPKDLMDQLAPGGVMVIPVASKMIKVVKDVDGKISTTAHGLYSFVPLIG